MRPIDFPNHPNWGLQYKKGPIPPTSNHHMHKAGGFFMGWYLGLLSAKIPSSETLLLFRSAAENGIWLFTQLLSRWPQLPVARLAFKWELSSAKTSVNQQTPHHNHHPQPHIADIILNLKFDIMHIVLFPMTDSNSLFPLQICWLLQWQLKCHRAWLRNEVLASFSFLSKKSNEGEIGRWGHFQFVSRLGRW